MDNKSSARSGRYAKSMLALFWLLLFESRIYVSGQGAGDGCSNACPPINFGTEVPALCVGDTIDTFVGSNINKVYDVCYPKTSNGDGIMPSFRLSDFRMSSKHVIVIANYYTGCNAGRRESGVYAHVAQRYL